MLVFDIETDGLLNELSKIHTMTIYDTETKDYKRYDKELTSEGVARLDGAEVCGHNIIAFDIPAIKKLYPSFKPKKVLDTLVMARLALADIKELDLAKKNINTKLYGSHSLRAWGERLGVLKGDYGETTDWQEWSKEMSDYCEQDVRVTVALLEYLKKFKLEDSYALTLEHKVQEVISRQIAFGFMFDKERAEDFYIMLLQRQSELLKEFREIFPARLESEGEFIPKVNNKTKGYTKGVPFTKLKLKEFKPSSGADIAKFFIEKYKWHPESYTDTREPKVDTEVLEHLSYPEAPKLCEYQLISKRLSQLATGSQALIGCCELDGRIHGYVNSCGAVTGRMTHSRPNVAQVPAVKLDKEGNYLYGASGDYQTEFRELFIVPKGYKLVGCDASGLELRTLSHYLARYDDGAYGREVVSGDIHTANQKAAGLPTRNSAKTFIYSWLYGGGDLRIGLSINNPLEQVRKLKAEYPRKYEEYKKRFLKDSFTKDGKHYTKVSKGRWVELNSDLICYAIDGWLIKERFLKSLPALTSLREDAAAKAKSQKFIKGLDGRTLKIRSAHSALNVLLQSAGAIVMKQYLITLDELLQRELKAGEDYEFVANIHDEVQIQVKEEYATRVSEICLKSFELVTEFFKFRIPLAGEAKIGNSWKETH